MTGNRVTLYGYAGGWGYREHDTDGAGGSGDGEPDNVLMASPTDGFPFLHLGARYYDPALGRFLQRDPIGIFGGQNAYLYNGNQPVQLIDPSGLLTLGFGASTTATAGAVGGSFEGSAHIGWSWKKGWTLGGTFTCGIHLGMGWGIGAGVVATGTNADGVGALMGVSHEIGVDTPFFYGPTASYIEGEYRSYQGAQVGITPGLGIGAIRIGTNVSTGGSVSITNEIAEVMCAIVHGSSACAGVN